MAHEILAIKIFHKKRGRQKEAVAQKNKLTSAVGSKELTREYLDTTKSSQKY